MSTTKKVTVTDPHTGADPDAVAKYLAGAPDAAGSKTSRAKDDKRLTVDIPEILHKAMNFAKTNTSTPVRRIVEQALMAHPDVAAELAKLVKAEQEAAAAAGSKE